VKVNTENHNFISNRQLIKIIENYNRINEVKVWTSTNKRALQETAEGGGVTYFYLKNSLKKILIRQFGETGQRICIYYTLNDTLSFVIEKIYNYNRPITWDSISMKKNNDNQVFNFDKSETTIDSNYFINGSLIRKTNSIRGLQSDKNKLHSEQIRLQTEFQEMIKLLK